jgi:hypothetical protein
MEIYTTTANRRKKTYIKLLALYCNVVSSLIPTPSSGVTHIMMQFLSALLNMSYTQFQLFYLHLQLDRSVDMLTAVGQTISVAQT